MTPALAAPLRHIHDTATGHRLVGEAEAKIRLSQFGIRVPKGKVVANATEAQAMLAELRPPLAVKLVSRVSHKSDVDGVRLGITNATTLVEAFLAIEDAAVRHQVNVEGYLVEEMAPPGVEILVGGKIDRVFGPAVLVGLGGIYAEILDDVVLRICPISSKQAHDMIRELRAAPLLFGARGRPAVDVEELASVLMALGGPAGFLMRHSEDVLEVDLNPVIVSSLGAVAVDARIVMKGRVLLAD